MKKTDIKKPVLKTETIEMPLLGGSVTVRGLLLSTRMALFSALDKQQQYIYPSQLLAVTVLDESGEPIFTADEWDIWAGENQAEGMQLFNLAQKLSGLNSEETVKN
jgi:hypothetical protein